ncbi:hypothetical protein ACIO3O_37025 [Streptomyces sp. NPDC087440]|uniref:hypothetical protein n=1 Tax=Streptomyces sp. NPDC087440 TaxID=3365790 RepID=UPI003827B291
MPVTLDKTPPPHPEDMDRAPAYRPELRKLTAAFLVLAYEPDPRWTRTPAAPRLLTVDRASAHDVERALQRLTMLDLCATHHGLVCVEVRTTSAARAVGEARVILAATRTVLDRPQG